MPRDGREDVGRAGLAGCPRGSHFAARVHETGISHRSKQDGKGQVEAQNASTQVAIRKRDRVTRPECHVLKGAAILSKRHLAFGASVEIVEHGLGHSATCQRPEILHADHPWGRDFA